MMAASISEESCWVSIQHFDDRETCRSRNLGGWLRGYAWTERLPHPPARSRYVDRGEAERQETGTMRQAELDEALRKVLANEGVFPVLIEVEFA